MVWPLTGLAEVSYSLRFEHSEVSIEENVETSLPRIGLASMGHISLPI